VYLGCRSRAKAEMALQELQAATARLLLSLSSRSYASEARPVVRWN
jgi:hypothetical protein